VDLVAVMNRAAVIVALALVLAGCAPWQPTDRPASPRSQPDPPGREPVQSPPDWYRVRRGDTLYSIAFRYGLDWRRVAAWNDIGAPFTIRPGNELRMTAPPERSRPSQPQPARTANSSSGNDGGSEQTAPGDAARKPEPEPQPTPRASRADPGPAAAASDQVRTVGGVTWQWPTDGRVTRQFDPSDTRKGIGVDGEEGQAVRAAAAGEVVYSGTALIGYGELIIVKHSETLLSAYGHNRRRMVREGDRVQRGDQIAEMGLDDRQEERLHFEIRRNGEPVNPMDYLPRR
jgi:lipoprotein NlpD